MTSKEAFLSHIAKKLDRERMTTAPPREMKGPPDFWRKIEMSEEERVSRFAEECEQLGSKVYIFEEKQALLDKLKQLLQELAPDSVLTWERDILAEWGLDSVLAPWPVLERDDKGLPLEQAVWSMVGITAADYAIADTGTLVLCTNTQKHRSTSLLPIVHIALIRSDQIKARMGEVLAEFKNFKGKEAPSSIHFISGPSRSADIENDLTIGVHGPAALHVFVLNTLNLKD